MAKAPPHVLVTTPESLFILLGSESGRRGLERVETVIVDEIHALYGTKRGAHLWLSLERLEDLLARAGRPSPQRIGLSATMRPLSAVATALGGRDRTGPPRPVGILDLAPARAVEIEVALPPEAPLGPVSTVEGLEVRVRWMAERVASVRTTLVFVSTRRTAERLALHLGEALGEDLVAAHHGSLSKGRRQEVEGRLAAGELKVVVATASLELGIDVGALDLVIQWGGPRAIATFLQRVGRSRHRPGATPHGVLLPTTRDELVEALALVRALRSGRMDGLEALGPALDCVAQQVVAMLACGPRSEADVLSVLQGARGCAAWNARDFAGIVQMLCEGSETPSGRVGRWLFREEATGLLHARPAAKLTTLTAGGAIADQGDYRVLEEGSDLQLGTVHEDFAVESVPGDVFALGTQAWRIRHVRSGVVRVVAAGDAAPNVPFWRGEAPGRSRGLSEEVSSLRERVTALAEELEAAGRLEVAALAEALCARLAEELELPTEVVMPAVVYLLRMRAQTGVLPTARQLLVERVFDQAGSQQLLIHHPGGIRTNRALALILRKRFCRAFDQELQASATDEGLLISLGQPQSFRLDQVLDHLKAGDLEDDLAQAFLGTPHFAARWRDNCARFLLVPRTRGARVVPFEVRRMQAEDCLTAAFPEQTQCQEHLAGPVTIPDHPVVAQTIADGLHAVCDLDGLRELVARLGAGEVAVATHEGARPSPFASEVLNARPWAYLDDAPLEERRARGTPREAREARPTGLLAPRHLQAVAAERRLGGQDPVRVLASLDDLILWSPALPWPQQADERPSTVLLLELVGEGRLAAFAAPAGAGELEGTTVYALPARLEAARRLLGDQEASAADRDQVLLWAARLGEFLTSERVHRQLGWDPREALASLRRLATRGLLVTGPFLGEAEAFLERSVLEAAQRMRLRESRATVATATREQHLRRLWAWHQQGGDSPDAVVAVADRLAGFPLRAEALETVLLARLPALNARSLRRHSEEAGLLCGRLHPPEPGRRPTPGAQVPLAVWPRGLTEDLLALRKAAPDPTGLRGPAERLLALFERQGSLDHDELRGAARLLPSELDEGLGQLLAGGFLATVGHRTALRLCGVGRLAGRRGAASRAEGGRFRLLRPLALEEPDSEQVLAIAVARMAARFGVVSREVAQVEGDLPGYGRLLPHLRLEELRGRWLGGYFVQGMGGEQYLPATMEQSFLRLSGQRDAPPNLPPSDPLMLLLGHLNPVPSAQCASDDTESRSTA